MPGDYASPNLGHQAALFPLGTAPLNLAEIGGALGKGGTGRVVMLSLSGMQGGWIRWPAIPLREWLPGADPETDIVIGGCSRAQAVEIERDPLAWVKKAFESRGGNIWDKTGEGC